MNNQGKTAQYANIYLDEDALIVDSNTIMTFSGDILKTGGFCRYAGGWNVYDCAGQLERQQWVILEVLFEACRAL